MTTASKAVSLTPFFRNRETLYLAGNLSAAQVRSLIAIKRRKGCVWKSMPEGKTFSLNSSIDRRRRSIRSAVMSHLFGCRTNLVA